MLRNRAKQGAGFLLLITIASIFFSLGMWQWDRAQQSRLKPTVNNNLTSLESLLQPRIALPAKVVMRYVRVTGKYVKVFRAPNQVDARGRKNDWQVALLETNNGGAILIVRDYWDQKSFVNMTEEVVVSGRLLPHQNDNVADSGEGVLSRIDSALIANQRSLDLYGGYIVASQEQHSDVIQMLPRITPPAPKSAVPGFYWQHISYVVIWWLMIAVVFYLPFYQRRVQSRVGQASIEFQSREGEK